MICGPPVCGCAFQSETLTITNVDGVVSLEQAEFTDITDLQNDVANLQAAMDLLPDTYVDESGDEMSGGLNIVSAGTQLALARTDTDAPIIEFFDQSANQIGFLQGIEGTPSVMRLLASGGNDLQLMANSSLRAVITAGGIFLFGKAVTSPTTAGFEVAINGRVSSTTINTVAINYISNITTGDNGDVHFSVRRSNTEIGSISQATTTTTAFNTSSDEELKTNIREIDDDLALYWLRVTQPMLFEFKDFLSTPSTHAIHVGYIAQRLAAAWPEAIELGIVTPGYGDINLRTWDDDGNETTKEKDWKGWQVDYSKFTPFLHSGLQAIDRQVQSLEARIAALEAAAQ